MAQLPNEQQTNELRTMMTENEKIEIRKEILDYQQMSQLTMKTFDKYEKITKGNLTNVDKFVAKHREKCLTHYKLLYKIRLHIALEKKEWSVRNYEEDC